MASGWLYHSYRSYRQSRRGYHEVPSGVELSNPTISWTTFDQDQERQERVRKGLEKGALVDVGSIESAEFMRFHQEQVSLRAGAGAEPEARAGAS